MNTADEMRPDVSVVIPCFNTASFVEECLNSVITQTGVLVEILAIDDCSTDGTQDILRRMESGNSAIKLVRNAENLGQARSRNIGLDLARGRFVALLDSDDRFAGRDVLQRWVARAEELLCVALALVGKDFLIGEGLLARLPHLPVIHEGQADAAAVDRLPRRPQA